MAHHLQQAAVHQPNQRIGGGGAQQLPLILGCLQGCHAQGTKACQRHGLPCYALHACMHSRLATKDMKAPQDTILTSFRLSPKRTTAGTHRLQQLRNQRRQRRRAQPDLAAKHLQIGEGREGDAAGKGRTQYTPLLQSPTACFQHSVCFSGLLITQEAHTCRNSRMAASSAPASPSGSSTETGSKAAANFNQCAAKIPEAQCGKGLNAKTDSRSISHAHRTAPPAQPTCVRHGCRPAQPTTGPLGASSGANLHLVCRGAASLLQGEKGTQIGLTHASKQRQGPGSGENQQRTAHHSTAPLCKGMQEPTPSGTCSCTPPHAPASRQPAAAAAHPAAAPSQPLLPPPYASGLAACAARRPPPLHPPRRPRCQPPHCPPGWPCRRQRRRCGCCRHLQSRQAAAWAAAAPWRAGSSQAGRALQQGGLVAQAEWRGVESREWTCPGTKPLCCRRAAVCTRESAPHSKAACIQEGVNRSEQEYRTPSFMLPCTHRSQSPPSWRCWPAGRSPPCPPSAACGQRGQEGGGWISNLQMRQ